MVVAPLPPVVFDTYMSYVYAIFLSLSPMIGKRSLLPEISSMSLIQPLWLSTVLALYKRRSAARPSLDARAIATNLPDR